MLTLEQTHHTSPETSPRSCRPLAFIAFVVGAVTALFSRRRMTHAEFSEYAAQNPPADEWYDEDFSDVRRPSR